jgi:uncharacterized phage protein gp47/JayE
MDNAAPDGENGENGEAARPPSISRVINIISGAYNKLNGQNVKAAAVVNIRTEVCDEVREAIDLLRGYTICDEATTTLLAIRDEIKALKTSMKEATKAKMTYTEVAMNMVKPALNSRHERARHEVTLQATTDSRKENIATSTHRVITK